MIFGKRIISKKEFLPNGFEELLDCIREDFLQQLRVNLSAEPFSGSERRFRIKKRENLREALRLCGFGNESAKIFIKAHIVQLLSDKYGIDNENIDKFLTIDAEYKFKVLLDTYRERYGSLALENLIKDCFGNILVERNRKIDDNAVNRAFMRYGKNVLSFPEKMEILSQKIYESYKGNGVIDQLLPMTIDGISGGVSENKGCFTVWLMYKGNTVNLSFLKYRDEIEIKRICRNLCRSYGLGQLSEKKGYMVAELSDGSRAAISRPPFCESWSFFIRKFRTETILEIEDLINGEGADVVIKLIDYIVKGQRIVAVTGEQGSGKTTLLSAIVGFIPEWLNIRVVEMSFELHLRRRFPHRNIASFRETEGVGVQEGLDFIKKTDGGVTVLGEVASMQAVVFLVQLSQNASSFTLFTHHAKDTAELVHYIRNSLLMRANFRNERVALSQAVNAVNFNIHTVKNEFGERYIEKISEIVPESSEEGFSERIIVRRRGKAYVTDAELGRKTVESVYKNLSADERQEFLKFLRLWRKEENGEAIL